MPRASAQQRALMEKWFGDPKSDRGPIEFLESRGYVLRPDWQWDPPVPAHTVNHEEEECICFLVDEWDFGGLNGWVGTTLSYEDTKREWARRSRGST
jgi:hypothetical protein